MKKDPNTACENQEQRFWWAFLHDFLCHPLMALTRYSAWSLRFHDWTSARAWPDSPRAQVVAYTQRSSMALTEYGYVVAMEQQTPNFWLAYHPCNGQGCCVYSDNGDDAMTQILEEFRTWEKMFGDKNPKFRKLLADISGFGTSPF